KPVGLRHARHFFHAARRFTGVAEAALQSHARILDGRLLLCGDPGGERRRDDDDPGECNASVHGYVLLFARTYRAICSCVANHTPGFDFMWTISFSSPATRERWPVMCGCIVRMKRPPSSYATSNSDWNTFSTSSGLGMPPLVAPPKYGKSSTIRSIGSS